MKNLNLIFTVLCLGVTSSIQAANPGPYGGPDFIATQQSIEEGTDPSQGTVYFSKKGNRTEFDSPIGKTIAGADYAKGKCWFASTGQKIYVEGNIDKKTGDCDADLSMGPVGSEVIVGGLMSPQPCEGFSIKKKLGSKKLAGRTTEQWGCRDNQAGEAIQSYDAKLKLVISEETRYSKETLTNIKFKKIDPRLFSSPKGFKRVNKTQFMQAMMKGAMR